MRFIPSKITRQIYAKKIRSFLEDYKRNILGLIGLAILIMFLFVALFAPWLTSYNPTRDKYLAESIAMPLWIRKFPQYKDLPPTLELAANWDIKQGSEFVSIHSDDQFTVDYQGSNTKEVVILLESNFSYVYSSPTTFKYEFGWKAPVCKNIGYSAELTLLTPNGDNYSLCDTYYRSGPKSSQTQKIPFLKRASNRTRRVKSTSWDFDVWDRLGWAKRNMTLAQQVFSQKGEYSLLLRIFFAPSSEESTCELNFEDTKIKIPGMVHGILGTDHVGGDLFSQLVYGSQTSLMIGLLTSLFTVIIGMSVGIIAGYMGGVADELLMRITDITMCIPMLPIIITLAFLFGTTSMYMLVLLMSLLWWPGLARIIRSRVLTLRELTFVEAATAFGATKRHIMLKHFLPNVVPIAFAAFIVNISSAIAMEAAYSFIGLTPLNVPTWGKMIYYAFHAGAFQRFAWWWIIPPGMAVMVLSLAFMFVGHGVDEIINPRLRLRR